MSTQISVCLPDDLVEFLDRQIDEGVVANRDDMIVTLIRREQSRARARADLEIIRAHDGVPHPDLAGLSELAHRPPGDGVTLSADDPRPDAPA